MYGRFIFLTLLVVVLNGDVVANAVGKEQKSLDKTFVRHGVYPTKSIIEEVVQTREYSKLILADNNPTTEPTTDPSTDPTTDPTTDPSIAPSEEPTPNPTTEPTVEPTTGPTVEPSTNPTADPSIEPTKSPSEDPTASPTDPSAYPTLSPTLQPTELPTIAPSGPSYAPTRSPSSIPTIAPTVKPSTYPTMRPSRLPSTEPTPLPSVVPTRVPTAPTPRPSTAAPSNDIIAVQFDSQLTFNALDTEELSSADLTVVQKSAAASMSVDASNITISAQTATALRRKPQSWYGGFVLARREVLAPQYTIVVTITTTVFITGRTTPAVFYNTLTTRLNNAVTSVVFVNYLRGFQTTSGTGRTTFTALTPAGLSVTNLALVPVGAPTATPTRQPTYHLPRRLANGPLAGTVVAVCVFCVCAFFGLYRLTLWMRERRFRREQKLSTAKMIEVVEKQVFLPRQIEDGVMAPLEPVHRHALQRDIQLQNAGPTRHGVVQIVVESEI